MKKRYIIESAMVLFAVLMTGCSTYSKVVILQEENYKQIKLNSSEKYKVAELRFSSNWEWLKNKDTILDGRLYTEWLEKQYPNIFSTDENAIPIIVREKMTLPPELLGNTKEEFVVAFDAIFSQLTFFFWPASYTREIEFEIDIQLNDEYYSKPFTWNTKYFNKTSNIITKKLFFSSYGNGEKRDYATYLSKFNKLERTIASKKTSEQQKLEAKDEQFWYFYGSVNTSDVMRQGTAYGIIGALSQLSSSQKQMVTENKVARYLVDKAEGKLNDNSQNALPAKVESIEQPSYKIDELTDDGNGIMIAKVSILTKDNFDGIDKAIRNELSKQYKTKYLNLFNGESKLHVKKQLLNSGKTIIYTLQVK